MRLTLKTESALIDCDALKKQLAPLGGRHDQSGIIKHSIRQN
jgi:hypothetical protein